MSNEYYEIFKEIKPNDNNLNVYVDHKFMESRNKKKKLTFLDRNEQLHEIKKCEIIDLNNESKNKITIEKLFNI